MPRKRVAHGIDGQKVAAELPVRVEKIGLRTAIELLDQPALVMPNVFETFRNVRLPKVVGPYLRLTAQH